MLRTVVAISAIAMVGAAVAVAQTDPIAQRKAMMKENGKNSGAVNRMIKGEDPFDAAKARAAFVNWADAAKKLPPLFASAPPAGADTRALPKIWENKADFDAKLATFGKAADDSKDKVKTLDELKVAFPTVSKACADCHEANRRPAPPGQKK